MTNYKTMNMKGLTGKDLKSGDRITINARFAGTPYYANGILVLSDKTIRRFSGINDLQETFVKLERPVENCKTEYKREDFHVGDKITWWYRNDPDNEYCGFITKIKEYEGDNFWLLFSGKMLIYPFDSRTYGENAAIVTNIEHVHDNNDEWEEVSNFDEAQIFSVEDTKRGVHVNMPTKSNFECITDAIAAFKHFYDGEGVDGIKYYRRKSKLCDLSRIDYGYFMLRNNARNRHGTNDYHDDTVYFYNPQAKCRLYKVDGTKDGYPVLEPISSLPCETFAVKPDAGILLKTINGDM